MTRERAALEDLTSYPPDFQLNAAAVKIAALQEENDRLYRRLQRMEDRYIDGEERSARREVSKVKESIHDE